MEVAWTQVLPPRVPIGVRRPLRWHWDRPAMRATSGLDRQALLDSDQQHRGHAAKIAELVDQAR